FSKTPRFENRTKTRRHKGQCCSVTLCEYSSDFFYRTGKFVLLSSHGDTGTQGGNILKIL
ncbi:MAG: hypothetical protein CVT88_05185, partial [Candidatus Altiarchaeales archaeon HGW-Altiarchaeales-1]